MLQASPVIATVPRVRLAVVVSTLLRPGYSFHGLWGGWCIGEDDGLLGL